MTDRRMTFTLEGRDRLSPVLHHAGDSADDMARHIDRASTDSSRAIEGLHRDANGRMRDMRGRFAGAAASVEDMTERVEGSSRRSRSALSRLSGAASGIGSAAMSAVPSMGALGGALQGVGIAAAITALPAVGALVPMLAGAGLAAGALKLGFSGVGDAMALAGTDAKAYHKALDKMNPAQRDFTKALVGAKKGFSGIAPEVQKAMLPGFTRALKAAAPLTKTLSKGLVEMGDVLGDTADQFGRLLKDSGFQKDFGQTLKQGTGFIREITGSLAPFTRSLIDFGAASGPTLKAFSDGIGGLLGKGLPGFFQGLKGGIQGSAAMFDGLFNAIGKVLPALGNLVGVISNAVGPALKEIFETAGDNGAMTFNGLAAVIGKLKPVFSEIGAAVRIFGIGLQSLGTIAGQTAGVIINSLWPSFNKADQAVGPLQKVSNYLKDNKQGVLEFTRVVSNALIDLFGAALDYTPKIIGAFRFMSKGLFDAFDLIVSGADAAFGFLPLVGPKIHKANQEFDKFKAGFLKSLNDAEAGSKRWVDTVHPRLEKNQLQMNIDNWNQQLAVAKDKLSTVPKDKKAALLADIRDLQRKVAQARGELNSLNGKTATTYVTTVMGRRYEYGSVAKGTARSGLATGGPVRGPGTGTSDDVPAMLSNGEYVIKAASVDRYGHSFLRAINNGSLRAFAKGGLVRGITKSEASTIKADTGHTALLKLTADPSQISHMAAELISDIQRAFKGTKTSIDDRLVTMLQKGNKKLHTLAAERDKLAARIKQAKDFAAGVSNTSKTGAALSTFDPQTLTSGSLLSGLQSKLANIRQFQRYIGILAKRGLNRGLLQQILEMGPEQGLPYASTLVGASASMLKSINSTQGNINKASTSLGNQGADLLYDSGKNAGRGFLAGLAGQQKSIEKLMLSIAKGMQKSIRTALGIHSPSRVFRQLGQYTTEGLALGLTDRTSTVESAMATVTGAMASTPISTPQLAAAAGRGGVIIHAPITIEGAMDPVAVGRQLEQVLYKLKRYRGGLGYSFG
jgi:hypothetical protein